MEFSGSITSDLIPTSFVKDHLTFSYETGHGEAKLYLNKEHNSRYYTDFFENYNDTNNYYFVKQNLLDYLNNQVIINEYSTNSHYYKNIDDNYRIRMINRICNSYESYIPLNFENRLSVDSQRRYYIRSYNDIFRELFRSIAIPKLTYLQIDKYEDDGKYIYYCLLMIV